jgi:NADPH:quinone reductase-like Zn-dependent oxidoreductase
LRHFTALERARRAVLIHGATGGVGLAAMIAHAQA